MDIFYYADNVALGVLIISMMIFLVRARRGGARGRKFAVGAWAYFFGAFITISLSFHIAENLWRIIPQTPISHGTKPVYDFRFYSLILFGAVMLAQGLAITKAAKRFALGETEERKKIIRRTLITLALCAPLIPIQIFGSVLTIIGLLNLAFVVLVQKRTAVSSDETYLPPSSAAPLVPYGIF